MTDQNIDKKKPSVIPNLREVKRADSSMRRGKQRSNEHRERTRKVLLALAFLLLGILAYVLTGSASPSFTTDILSASELTNVRRFAFFLSLTGAMLLFSSLIRRS